MLKVATISNKNFGGAGIQAYTTHLNLLENGIDSTFVCSAYSNIGLPKRNVHVIKSKTSARVKLYSKLLNRLARPNTSNISQVFFTSPQTHFRVEELPAVRNADVVHLHWISNFLNFPTFFRNIHKPIIWTLHDMNPFLGGLHYSMDLKRADQHILKKERKFADLKNHAYKGKNINVVTPSKWLGKESLASKALGKFQHSVIQYSVDFSLYKPIFDRTLCRNMFNLPQDKNILLFMSNNLSDLRKGGDIIVKILPEILDNPDNVLLMFDNSDKIIRHEGVISLPRITDKRLLSFLYNCADVCLLPSRQDNMPLTMLHSLSCGIPVISFDTGGMSEIIENNINGYLAKGSTPNVFLYAINKWLENPERLTRESIIEKIRLICNPIREADDYFFLYQSLYKGAHSKFGRNLGYI